MPRSKKVVNLFPSTREAKYISGTYDSASGKLKIRIGSPQVHWDGKAFGPDGKLNQETIKWFFAWGKWFAAEEGLPFRPVLPMSILMGIKSLEIPDLSKADVDHYEQASA